MSALLARWSDPSRLTKWEREHLENRYFNVELQPTRRRAPKLSAEAKAELLLLELEYRAWDAGSQYANDSEHDFLVRQHKELGVGRNAAVGAAERSQMDKTVVVVRGDRIPMGSQRRKDERAAALRDELGPAFIANKVDRAAQVRQWERRMRKRADRVSPTSGAD